MKYTIGLDVGGTKMHSIVAEWNKECMVKRKLPKIVKSRRFPFQNVENGSKFFKEIVEEAERLLEEFGKKNIARIGLGIATLLSKNKFILKVENLHLPLANFPIRSRMEAKLGIPIFVANDADCFTWAEHLFGAAHKSSSTVGITLGTGVGGGIVIDFAGKPVLWDGAHGTAMEIGHIILGEGQASFDQLCSSKATHLWRNMDPLSAAQKAEEGDLEAKEAYKRFGFWLGVAISNVINMIDPEMVVVGGSIAKSWNLFEMEMKKSIEQYAASPLGKKTKVVLSILGDEANALGAAYLP